MTTSRTKGLLQTKCSLPETTVNTIFYAHVAFAIISFHIFTCYIVHKSVNFDLPNSVNMFAFFLVASQHLKKQDVVSTCTLALQIQSPSENGNGVMEPKYISEEVIVHPNHHLTG